MSALMRGIGGGELLMDDIPRPSTQAGLGPFLFAGPQQ